MWKIQRASTTPVPRSPAVPGPDAVPGTGPPVPTSAPVRTPPRTRAGSTWVLACVAVVVLIVLIVFIAQNSGPAGITFFSLHGRFPLAVILLAAVAAGCLLTLAVGSTRILQLRRIVRRRHRDDLAATARAEKLAQTPDTGPGPSRVPAPLRGADAGPAAVEPADADSETGVR
jgi:uncharacterized integral membrane protein